MKAKRDDLVLRISSVLRTYVEVCEREKSYAPRLLSSKWPSCSRSRRCTPSNHPNDALAPRCNNPCLYHSTRSSHGDQARLARTVTRAADPVPPIEKVAKDLRVTPGI
jgi:hypothetical protein